MATEVILPRVDMDMATGKFGRWCAADGERVREGQILFEIETDKAAMEIEAPASGLLRGLRAQAGDVLPVGAVVAWIVGENEAFDPDLQALAGELRALLAAPAAPVDAPAPATNEGSPSAPLSPDAPTRATPLARRLARERGLDLDAIAGSGPLGRVQARDVPLAEVTAPALASAAGGRLHRLWLQRGESAPLVLIHGFGADLNGWRPLVGRLPEAISALAIDLPGHGASPLSGEPTLAAFAAAVAATLAEEGVATAHLAGHSLGGAVAAALAVALDFRALSLALIAPAGLGPEINAAFLAGFLRARSPASLAPWLRLLTADPDALGPALLKTTLRQREAADLVAAQTRVAEALFPDGAQTIDIRPWLARLSIPAKVILGVEDRVIPAHQAKGLSGTIALHRFAGVGHMPHFEARAEVARLVAELVAAGEPGRAGP